MELNFLGMGSLNLWVGGGVSKTVLLRLHSRVSSSPLLLTLDVSARSAHSSYSSAFHRRGLGNFPPFLFPRVPKSWAGRNIFNISGNLESFF